MATNKRKDAAALFELIDKSTLKVPKNAGAIRIPSWWSAKGNPPAEGVAGVAVPPKGGAGPVRSAPGAGSRSRAEGGAEAPATPEEPVVASTPLFSHHEGQAGVASVPEPVAPSIRPPASPAPISPSVTPPARPVHETIPPQKGVFAPATMGAQTAARKNWFASQKQALMRMPMYVPIGAMALVSMIVLIAFMSQAGKSRDNTPSGQNPFAQTNMSTQQSGLENSGVPLATRSAVTTRQQIVGPRPEDVETGSRRGRLYEGTDVQWNKELFYIVIASYPTNQLKMARDAAAFLQDNGVDVVLSTNNSRKTPTLITYRGFPSNAEAEAYIKRIVEIGKRHKDAKKGGKAPFYDAYAVQIKPK